MMEKLAGKTWEELVVEQIFDPLRLASAGFGPQSSIGRVDAPLGHAPTRTERCMLSWPVRGATIRR